MEYSNYERGNTNFSDREEPQPSRPSEPKPEIDPRVAPEIPSPVSSPTESPNPSTEMPEPKSIPEIPVIPLEFPAATYR